MQITQQHTRVLIVGAGPSGLMMAAQLLRYGIQPLIIDSRQGPTNHSKALAVQARSLEIYRQMGIIDKVLAGGARAEGIAIFSDGEKRAELQLGRMGKVTTPYPYILMYPQSRNERQLLDLLTQNCCPVYWNTSLFGISQTEHETTATIQSDGAMVTITCDWIIGADGAHSTVRKQMNIPFEGDTYKHRFYLIDGKVGNLFESGILRAFISKNGFAAFFPMPDEGYCRIIGDLPPDLTNIEEPQLEQLLPRLKDVTGMDIDIEDRRWLVTYKLHHRMAQHFRSGRCFLIGDAAHIHSPVGGQGMNTGLQDAYNLAWKLAGVINGKIDKCVLDSYADERMPVAKNLLRTTDRAFNVITSRSMASRWLKKYVILPLLHRFWAKENMREAFFKAISQTAISYRDSKINLHLSNANKLKAGDRLPCLKIYDEKQRKETDLHQWCAKPGFTLIAMADLQEMDLFAIARWITQKYPGILNFFYLPPSEKNKTVYDAFEITRKGQKAIIVRPDMHIGFINDWVDMPKMDKYLQEVMGIYPITALSDNSFSAQTNPDEAASQTADRIYKSRI